MIRISVEFKMKLIHPQKQMELNRVLNIKTLEFFNWIYIFILMHFRRSSCYSIERRNRRREKAQIRINQRISTRTKRTRLKTRKSFKGESCKRYRRREEENRKRINWKIPEGKRTKRGNWKENYRNQGKEWKEKREIKKPRGGTKKSQSTSAPLRETPQNQLNHRTWSTWSKKEKTSCYPWILSSNSTRWN